MGVLSRIIFGFFICVLLFSCTSSVLSGYSKVTGKFSDSFLASKGNNSETITLTVTSPTVNQPIAYETKLKPNGTFSFSIPLACPVYATISSQIYNDVILLEPNLEVKFEVLLGPAETKHVKMIRGERISEEEFLEMHDAAMACANVMQSGVNITSFNDRMDKPNVYRDATITRMEKDLEILKNNTKLPEKLKRSLISDIMLSYLQNLFFNKERYFAPIKPDKSFYSFLSCFDWNNPPLSGLDSYSNTLQLILSCDSLNIPDIGDNSVNDWIKEVKIIIADLIGFETGVFYDFLAANAYSKQINDNLQSLSDEQKENIRLYFNKSITDILLSENEKLKEIEFMSFKKKPDVPKEELLSAIIYFMTQKEC